MNVIENVSTWEKHEVERQAETCGPLAEHLEKSPQLTEDTFAALMKTLPRLVDEEELARSQEKARRRLLAAGLGTKEWSGLRDFTVRNPFLAAHATPRVMDEVKEKLEGDDEYKRAKQELDEYEDFIKDLEKADPTTPPTIPESWEKYANERRGKVHHTYRQAMRKAATVAEKDCEELAEAMIAWGLEDGPNTGMEAGALRELTERVMGSEKLKKIARLAGRMERVAEATHDARCTDRPEVICDVQASNDLGHILPTELACLAEPRLQPLFLRRYLESQLLCYQLEGKEPLGRGPIVMLYDGSGSMSGAPEIWAKAIVFGLLTIAGKENRDVLVFEFSSYDQISMWSFPAGAKDPAKLVEMAEHFFGGGTDPRQAIEVGLAAMQGSAYDKADMIVVSDGEFMVEDTFLEKFQALKKERGARMITVGIGNVKMRALEAVADDQYTILDVTRDEEVTNAAFAI